uniref:uncharacterized protein ccdc141 n=1 Tax=Semicossyphus pulcher TaxID=241346 RepID=UPI0037E93A2C
MTRPPSFTTLSTIAVQAGQSLIVVSVLKSGSLVHLQLVQVHPGLCGIGSNQEENQTLIQELQQLMDKLKKHEKEVLSVVETSERRKQRRSRKQEEELHKAMTASLKEGWSLLLRLMERRQEVLLLASDFYSRALEFAASIDRVEALMIRPDDRWPEAQLTYDSVRRDLLGKSLQVLSSSSVLLQKLRQLQRTEALQRRGGVLQDEEDEGEKEEEKSSQRSRGEALRLEELVETLQDRRRRADQAVRLQLQQSEKGFLVHEEEQESREESFEELRLTVDEILDQNLQSESESEESTDLQLESRTKETRELTSGPTSNVKSGSRSDNTRDQEPKSSSDLTSRSRLDETKDMQPETRSDLQSGSRSDLPPALGLEKNLKPGSKSGETVGLPHRSRSVLPVYSRSEETTTFVSGFRLGSRLQLKSTSRPEGTRDQKAESISDPQPELRLDLQPGLGFELHSGCRPKGARNLQSGFNLNQTPGSRSDVQPGSRLDLKPQSTSESSRHVEPASSLKEIKTLQFGIKLNMKAENRSDLHSDSESEETRDVEPGFMLERTRGFEAGSRSDLKPESTTDVKLQSGAEETKDQQPELRSELHSLSISENTELQPQSTLDLQPEFRTYLKPGSKSGETIDLSTGARLELHSEARSEETRDFLAESDLQPGSRLDPKPASRPNGNRNLQSGQTSVDSKDLQQGSRSEHFKDVQPESGSDLKPESRSGETLDLQHESRSDIQPRSRPELKSEFGFQIKPASRLEETINLQSGFKLSLKAGSKTDQMPGSRSDVQPGSGLVLKPQSTSESNRHVETGSTSKEIQTQQFGIKLNLNAENRSALVSDYKSEDTKDVEPGFILKKIRDFEARSRSDLKPRSKSNLELGCRSEETKDQNLVSRSDLQPVSRSENKELQPQSSLKTEPKFRSCLKPGRKSTEPIDLTPGSRSDLPSESRSEEIKNLLSEFKSHLQPGSRSDVKQGSRSQHSKDLEPESSSDLNPEPRSQETLDLQPGSRSDLQPGFGLQIKPGSRPEEIRNLQSGFKLSLKAGSKTDQMPGSRPHDQPESRLDTKSISRSLETEPISTSEETRILMFGFKSNLQAGYISDLKADYKSEETRDMETGSRSVLKTVSRSDLKPGSSSDDKKDQKLESRSDLQSECISANIELQSGSTSDLKPEFRPFVKPESTSGELVDLPLGSKSDLQLKSSLEDTRNVESKSRSGSFQNPGSRSEDTRNQQRGSTLKQEETKQHRAATTSTSSVQATGQESMLGKESHGGEDHTHQSLLTNQRKQLLLSCEHLVDKIWGWVQQVSSVLSDRSEVGRELSEAEDTLSSHLQLHAQAESAGHDAEDLKHILDQIKALHTDPTSLKPPSEPSRQLSPLKALTEQLKRGNTGSQTRTDTAQPSMPAVDPIGSLSPELCGRVDLVLKELQSLNRKIDSNLQLLQPYVTFLRMAQQVKEDMEAIMEIYRREPGEEKEQERKAVKKKQVDTCWQETLLRFLTCQELGNNFINTVSKVSGAEFNVQSGVSVVQQTLEQLSRTKHEMTDLLSHQQIEIQQQQEYCRKYQERFLKTFQDMKCVFELLDSCALMDLGSDLQTNRLLEHFSQATPHFKQLDAEVEHMVKSWETLRGVQESLEFKEFEGRTVKEDDLSELLKLQKRVKKKIHQSASILDLTHNFHLTYKQLEGLLQSDPENPLTGSTGACGSSEAELSRQREKQQLIQSLFKQASTLKTDICTAVNQEGQTCFRVEQLEARLVSLDSLCVSWLNEANQREQNQLLTRQLNRDINQLRDSFKELKKRFSNLKFNFMKRNDRTRNMKAVRNQLQQVEMYEEKLQALRKRLQGVTARLGSEVKDGGIAREAEDAINELQRQMGEFERSVSEHQKTLEMTCKLQKAMEEYQVWCEEASATIARVGKFSSECRSTEAVSVLYQQFEKFVWPTVPQQEERISQISELAVRLHGVEEGQRYIEKTVSKHSEMVQSIRELSDGLMELEAKLKMENLKRQQNEGEKEKREETERRRENETEEKDKEKEKKGHRKFKKKEQTDNRATQEKAEMYELKETGHTPELTAEHDGKEVPVKRQTAANRKPPLQKSRSQEADTQTESRQHPYRERSTSSYCSTHTFSLSCSPVEANRRIHSIHSQSQPVASEPQAAPPFPVICPSFSDIQREFQRKDAQETRHLAVSASCGSNTTPLQDALAGGLSESELQQQEVMTEDSLSNDEYECASPDDISLPPLAETPESIMVQSDLEEGFCFSSHSVHINQYSHQYHAPSDHSGNSSGSGAVQQQRESSCPTPPTSLHSSTRSRSETSSLVQSLLPVPASSTLTSTLCGIQITVETSIANATRSVDRSLGRHEPSLPSESYPVNKNSTPDTCSNTDKNFPEKKIPSQTGPLLENHSNLYNQPQRTTGTQLLALACNSPSSAKERPLSGSKMLSKIDPVPQFSKCAESASLTDYALNKESTPPRDIGLLKSCATCLQTSTTLPQDSNLPQSYPNSRSGLDQDVLSSQSSNETVSVSMPQDSSLTTTTTVTQKNMHCQSFPPNGLCNVPQASSNIRSKQESPLSQDSGGLPEVHPANSISNISTSSSTITSSNTFSNKQNHQTVFSLHGSLTSTCTQQSVHDPGMTPSSPAKLAAPPQPESQTQALPQQVNPHVTPSSQPHLLTPDQDPNICQPMAIREEIKLTPQIQGPPLPAPPPLPQAQAESLPQGKASKPGPPCFTRPMSRATVMEGSPVTLEVEVTGHPQPALTWWVAYNQLHNNTETAQSEAVCCLTSCHHGRFRSREGEMSATDPDRALACEDGKHFLFIPEALDSDGGLNEARADKHHDPLQAAGNSSSGDKWLVTEVLDIINVDWQTWFGTLCVLLWLLYLIIL